LSRRDASSGGWVSIAPIFDVDLISEITDLEDEDNIDLVALVAAFAALGGNEASYRDALVRFAISKASGESCDQKAISQADHGCRFY
jgi:hypothetical protein